MVKKEVIVKMSRYVDVEWLIKESMPLSFSVQKWVNEVQIMTAPSIDIVRCKECRHSFINENHPQKPRICGLTKMCGTTKDDWYCADGERREP